MTVTVAALYRFTPVADPAAVRGRLLPEAHRLGVKGTLLLAAEGLNGTLAGTAAAIDTFVAILCTLPGCAGLDVAYSTAAAMPFHRLKIRVKREIVTMGVPGLDPTRTVGTYVAPAEWNALIDDPDTIVIDTRNDYEVQIGSFARAVDPGTASFADFPAWVRDHRDDLAARRIAMFCTGGIRCEKATAFLKGEGVTDVFHLKGGILGYLEEIPADQSRWQGECFVFDERVAVGHGLAAGVHGLCRACRMPVTPAERASPLFEEGVSCPRCHATRTAGQRAGYAERHRQALLAAARGGTHVGAAFPAPDRRPTSAGGSGGGG